MSHLTRRSLIAGSFMLMTACRARGASADFDQKSILDYIPLQHRLSLRGGSPQTDLTTYFAQALRETRTLVIPEGTYSLTGMRIPPKTRLITAGFQTRFRQLPSAGETEPLILIEGSDVEIGDCAIEGIIQQFRTGGSEFNHGIMIAAREDAPALRNVRIGNILGRNLRGDAINILCEGDAILDDVHIAGVQGDNILRNVVAIVGGNNIQIGRIEAERCGYAALDIEPEGSYSAPVETVRVALIKGAMCAIQATPDTYARDIEIDFLDTNPAYSANSSPAFVDHRGNAFDREGTGLLLRNATAIRIGFHRAKGHRDHAVKAVDDRNRAYPLARTIEFGEVDYSGIGQNERTYHALINANALEQITIRKGSARLANDEQAVIVGRDQAPFTRCTISNLSADGMIARNVVQSEFTNLNVRGGRSRGLFQAIRDSRISNSSLNAGFLGYNLANVVIESTVFTKASGGPYVINGPATRVTLRSATIDGKKFDGEFASDRALQRSQ